MPIQNHMKLLIGSPKHFDNLEWTTHHIDVDKALSVRFSLSRCREGPNHAVYVVHEETSTRATTLNFDRVSHVHFSNLPQEGPHLPAVVMGTSRRSLFI